MSPEANVLLAVTLPPLDIKCTKADCSNDLHCFRKTRQLVKEKREGQCRYCGASLVDWPRLRQRNLRDAAYTIEMLKREWVRHIYWHAKFDEDALRKARKRGRRGLRNVLQKRIRSSVGKAAPFRDGWQTPWRSHYVYYAQHATASCCRRCIEEWHGIPLGRELTEAEIAYLTDLGERYLLDQLPMLTDDGEELPPRRARASE